MNSYGFQKQYGSVWKAGLSIALLWAASAAGQQDAGLRPGPTDSGPFNTDVLHPFRHDGPTASINDHSKRATRACLAQKIEAAYVAAAQTGGFFLPSMRCPPATGLERYKYRARVLELLDRRLDFRHQCLDEWATSHPITQPERSILEGDLKQFQTNLIDLQFNENCPVGSGIQAQSVGRGAGDRGAAGCGVAKGVGWR